ncbi:uncharacterized protein LOC127971108 [Carassius gibelio]|uniref:uncharacterized protein LOC127971108 n=1 Tax=Carassius gibelio TaxID=101364 RepID=UPI0022799912|nr:uncharacterized protein LOC127971108 [Carassius gibelio]XP_052429873.1 uncharacterized protein LOC127971108 [Carassius gibelio]XP_052429874.1 uncharacterized protein LOC127971108 [Carassius gibelio]
MSWRRCVLRCERKSTLFGLPKDDTARNLWLSFIYNTVPEQYNTNIRVCAAHFTEDCFLNLGEYKANCAQRLLLKSGAVPTLQGQSGASDLQPRTSQQALGTEQLSISSRSRDVSCQTDSIETLPAASPKTRSVGTQLSLGTLNDTHAWSKGTWATVSSFDVGAETTPSFPLRALSSTPITFPQHKRPRLELDEEEEDTDISESIAEPHHSAVTEESGLWEQNAYNVSKYIVFESCLRELFETCPLCKTKCDVQCRRMGSYVSFTQRCPKCSYHRKWESQPVIGSTPVGNLLVSAATYFCGASFIQFEKICKAMHLQIIQYETFRRHVRNYLEPAVIHKWKIDQKNLFRKLQEAGKIVVAGEMRADTPGRSAKYGIYSLMHPDSNTILDMQLVQSNEVGGSCHMEKEGLKRCLDHLEANSLAVEYIITHRQPQIQEFLRERNIIQFYDVWHFEKGLSIKLNKLSQKKGYQILKKWLRSIKNHVYWSAKSSTSGPEKVAKWTSLLNHIQNKHIHENPEFPKCAHPEKVSKDPKKWFQPGSMPLYKVEKILNNKRVLKDVEKLSHHYRTSSLEAFHRVILRVAQKNVIVSFIGMLCRLYLAAMHYNEQATTASGQPMNKVAFSKSKKGACTAKPLETAPSNDCVADLMKLIFKEVFADPAPFVKELKQIPIPPFLSSQFERPSKEEVVGCHISRFSQGAVENLQAVHPDQGTPAESEAQHRDGRTTLTFCPK